MLQEPENKVNEKQISKKTLNIQLNDIIQIKAPVEDEINDKMFLVKYIDKDIITLLSVDEPTFIYNLIINEDGTLRNQSIVAIDILSSDEMQGYSRQNGLLPGIWVDIKFGGDLPTIITGYISNLEEDMIEIQTYPENEKIYLDFAYKGLPQDLPIETINIREPPEEVKKKTPYIDEDKMEDKMDRDDQFDDKFDDQMEEESNLVEELPIGEVRKQIRELLLNVNDIVIGEDLGEIDRIIDLPESEQRFGIEKQTSDLLDELLSSIPNAQRTTSVLNNIHKMIERFKQLRQEFSNFDEYGNAQMPISQGANYKPLVQSLKQLNKKLYWILPVCKNKKKVYDVDINVLQEYSDIVNLTLAESRNAETDIINAYRNNRMTDTSENNKYDSLINSLNPYLTPFENPNNQEFSITSQQVNDNFTAIIDNLDELQSSVVKNDNVLRRKFVIQTYNLGLSKLQNVQTTSRKVYFKREPLTPNDNIDINGFITLPEPTVIYSHINLPSTNILVKSNLNQHNLNYWQFLKKNTAVNNYRIEDLNADELFQKNNYLNDIKEYTLNENIDVVNKYEKYLNVIVPKTRVLFELVEKYIKDGLSLYKIVKYLEPFLIYHKDLSFKQYETIIEYIDNKIREFNRDFVDNQKEFRYLSKIINKIPYKPEVDFIFKLYSRRETQDLERGLLEFYKIDPKKHMTNNEALNKMIYFDGGKVLNLSLGFKNSALMSAQLPEQIDEASKQINEKRGELKMTNECEKYVLSKKYFEIDELEDDNGKEIYFDKRYDTTRYDIIKEYKKERNDMEELDFLEYLAEKLENNIKMSRNDALREANAMILGKRKIEEGDYAMLDFDKKENGKFVNQILYYKRTNNIWVLDETITSANFIENTKLFCNIQPNCFQVKNNCDDIPLAEIEIKSENNKKLYDEYKDTLSMNNNKIKEIMAFSLDYKLKIGDSLINIQNYNLYKYNNERYKLGQTVDKIEIKKSPHSKLRDLILGLADFSKKQQLIVQFATTYTREPSENENNYWLYCKETNIQLLPIFLQRLASVYISKGNYFKEVEKVCAEHGKLSDDGESWVDEHSGYEIIKVSYSNEEGYDEQGFKISTRDTLEEEIGKKVLQQLPSKNKYDSKDAQYAFNIVKAMSIFMGINIEDQHDFIVTKTIQTLADPKAMPSKERYEKMIQKAAASAKGQTKFNTYEDAYEETLVYLTLSYLLVALITAIPSIKTRKTFPTCIKSFTGYPLTGIEDKTGLVYISCITAKIGKASKPWSVLGKTKQSSIESKLEKIIGSFILPSQEIQDKLTAKREFLASNPEESIPEEHSIEKWINFLPPLKPIQINSPQPVTSQFKDNLLGYMREGNEKQSEGFNLIQNKIIIFSLAIQTLIEKVVSSEEQLLKTSSSKPYLENACCNSEGLNTINYFIAKQPNIMSYNNIVKEYGNIIYDAEKIAEASILFDPENTKFKYPEIEQGFSKEVIYLAMITYCRFNNNIPISDSLRDICLEKPDEYNPDDSLYEKIRILEREGRNYSIDTFETLMDVVNRRNIISLNLSEVDYSHIEHLRKIIDKNIENNKANKFQTLLYGLLNTYEIALEKQTNEMKNMKNFLNQQNKKLKTIVIDFITKNTKSRKNIKNIKNKVKDLISNIGQFSIIKDTILKGEDETIYKVINFIKNTIRNIIDVFPNIITNKVDYSDINIPKQWGMSQMHALQIKQRVAEHYETLSKFYSDDEVAKVTSKIEIITRDLNFMVEKTPFLSSIMRDDTEIFSVFDKEISIMIFEYYFLTAFNRYIELANDTDLLITEIPVVAEIPETLSSVQVRAALTGEISEIEIVQGEKKELSKKIASLLLSFTEIIANDKKVIDYNYEKIIENVIRIKEREKDEITDYLEKLTKEERDVESIFKNNKLERWSIGLQKGLREYDPDFFDKEREKAEQMALQDIRLGKNGIVNDLNREIFRMDMVDQELANIQADTEAYDIGVQPDDDDYGDREGLNDMLGYYYDMGGMQPDYDD